MYSTPRGLSQKRQLERHLQSMAGGVAVAMVLMSCAPWLLLLCCCRFRSCRRRTPWTSTCPSTCRGQQAPTGSAHVATPSPPTALLEQASKSGVDTSASRWYLGYSFFDVRMILLMCTEAAMFVSCTEAYPSYRPLSSVGHFSIALKAGGAQARIRPTTGQCLPPPLPLALYRCSDALCIYTMRHPWLPCSSSPTGGCHSFPPSASLSLSPPPLPPTLLDHYRPPASGTALLTPPAPWRCPAAPA